MLGLIVLSLHSIPFVFSFLTRMVDTLEKSLGLPFNYEKEWLDEIGQSLNIKSPVSNKPPLVQMMAWRRTIQSSLNQWRPSLLMT